MGFKIIPGILTDDVGKFKTLANRAESVSERLHIDIIEAKFADNETIKPGALEDFHTSLMFDYHLMVDNPIEWLEECLRGGADRVFGHIEKMPDQAVFFQKAKDKGLKAGLVIDLQTGIDSVADGSYSQMSAIIVMSVKAGFGGQEFAPKALSKIEKLSDIKLSEGLDFDILVDGGVNDQNLADILKSGGNSVILGNRIFEGDLKSNIEKLKNLAL